VKDLPQLVFVGKIGWGVDDLLKDLQLDPRTQTYIQILNHVTDEELALLYESSLFTLYPSLYEGWGLPIAESLAHGKFCLVADNSSLPEVGGNFVEYLNAWDVPSWAKRIEWYCQNPQALHEKEQLILENYQTIPWQDSSKKILNSAADLLPS
jgi:glycosyltransferase involved in cell wall biosynthesis